MNPLSRFAAAPPGRGSGVYGRRPAVEAGARAGFSVGAFCLCTSPSLAREGERGRVISGRFRPLGLRLRASAMVAGSRPLRPFGPAPPRRGSNVEGHGCGGGRRLRILQRRAFLLRYGPLPAREGVRGGSSPVLSTPRFGGRALALLTWGGKQGRNRGASRPAGRRPLHPVGADRRARPVASAGVGPAPGVLCPPAPENQRSHMTIGFAGS